MKTTTTHAVILRARDYGESDRLVAFYSQAGGRLTGFAKGAKKSRRRFVNSFETCNLVQITFKTRKSLVWIEACKLIEPYLPLRTDLTRCTLAALVCEIFLEMAPEGEPHEKWFDLLGFTLRNLSEDRDPLNAVLLFTLRFLDIGGYLPAMNECSICRAPLRSSKSWAWHMRKGVLACEKHDLRRQEFIDLDLGALVLIAHCRQASLEKIWRHRFAQERRIPLFLGLMDMIGFHIGKALKCLHNLNQLQNGLNGRGKTHRVEETF